MFKAIYLLTQSK